MTDEKFFAWLDGELSHEEATEVANAVAADPALTAKADRHRAFAVRMKAAFDPVMAEAAPPLPVSNVIDFSAARQGRRGWLPARAQWAALAATLVVGLATTTLLFERGTVPHIDQPAMAGGELAAALDTQLASAPVAGSPIRIGLTFRTNQGALCRSFTQPGASGLACHEDGGWHVRGKFASDGTPDGGSDYRMAAGTDPRLAALIDGIIAGDPLDARAEAAARARRWR
ncbi:MAG: anti-sigma factor [Sphingomicrobium sp.]